MKKMTNLDFINKAKEIHGDKYDYSLVEYESSKTKININCYKHGSFFQLPSAHIRGDGCPNCVNNKKLDTKEFIIRANTIHNFKYDYSKTIYKNSTTKLIITCPLHGDVNTLPNSHLFNYGCKKCSGFKLSNESFIEKANIAHNNRYDYSNVNYINNRTKINIICPKHGSFKQMPNNHLNGSGCPICKESKGEREIREHLESRNIIYLSQHKFHDCRNIRPLPFDFYLPEHNICIEYDGIQHYEIIPNWGGKKRFETIKKCDNIKTKYCLENNIKLIRLNYNSDIRLPF